MSRLDPETRDELLQYFHVMFPEGSSPRNWTQTEYKQDLFRIFRGSYARGPVHGEVVWTLGKEAFLRFRNDLGEDDEQTLSAMSRAWNEWRYAWDNLPDGMDRTALQS